MAGLRVVLDTNVLVSGLAYPASIPGHIVSSWRNGGLEVVLSRFILDEFANVLPRLSRIKLSSAEIRDLVDSLMFLADVDVVSQVATGLNEPGCATTIGNAVDDYISIRSAVEIDPVPLVLNELAA